MQPPLFPKKTESYDYGIAFFILLSVSYINVRCCCKEPGVCNGSTLQSSATMLSKLTFFYDGRHGVVQSFLYLIKRFMYGYAIYWFKERKQHIGATR